MPGALGIVTAFARILVSEPYQPLGITAVLALAAGDPSPDVPAIHPILTYLSRSKGPLKATSMLQSVVYAIRLAEACGRCGTPIDTLLHPRQSNTRRGAFDPKQWHLSVDRMPPDPDRRGEAL
jgi:hypothetical protein